MKPISPEDIDKSSIIPSFVIEIINNLINKEYHKGSAVVMQEDIVNGIINKSLNIIPRDKIFANKWLEIEEIYEKAGWDVKYEKPGYNEEGDARFIFDAK